MPENQMSLLGALRTGWDWMVQMLFRPFELRKWLVVGFSAWLAGLADGGGGGGGGGGDFDASGDDVMGGLRDAWAWLTTHEWMAALIAVGCLVGVAIVVLLLWISSRGKFVFLDNVVHDRAAIAVPWRRYARIGNSLFAFRLAALLAVGPVLLGSIGATVWLAYDASGGGRIAAAVLTGLLSLFLLLVVLYGLFFLDAFVVPLMHRFDLGVMAGWRRFLELFQRHPIRFLVSGLFVYALFMLALIVILTTGLLTCCLGFVLLLVPYVSTLVLLPLIVTYRAFTVSFLAQFDDALVSPARNHVE